MNERTYNTWQRILEALPDSTLPQPDLVLATYACHLADLTDGNACDLVRGLSAADLATTYADWGEAVAAEFC